MDNSNKFNSALGGEPFAYAPESAVAVFGSVGWIHVFNSAGNGEGVIKLYSQDQIAPLQAEIEHLRAGGALIVQHMNDYKKERDQLKAEAEQLSETSMSQESMIEQLIARCDELEGLLREMRNENYTRLKDIANMHDRVDTALSKPSGSEQV